MRNFPMSPVMWFAVLLVVPAVALDAVESYIVQGVPRPLAHRPDRVALGLRSGAALSSAAVADLELDERLGADGEIVLLRR